MPDVPKPERLARTAIGPWTPHWRQYWKLHPALRFAIFFVWVAFTAALVWSADQRPYDLWANVGPPVRAPADLTCDRWTSGKGLTGSIERGEEVRILARKRMEGVEWMRVGRKAGGACWLDSYYWDEAAALAAHP